MGPVFEGTFVKGDLVVGLCNFLANYFTNYAIKFVSYPVVVLVKSSKVIFIVLIGSVSGVYKPSLAQFMIAFTITAGLIIFNSGDIEKSTGDSSVIGIGLLVTSLIIGGIGGS